ncbi:MAG: hypothetical protein HY056_08615 [Proteobacteria bacterium]|nr:hypothetical protein [Pseudomonadota bacterium]
MITGRFNIILGLVTMFLAGITGFALGLTLERYFQSGYAQITFWRQLTRVGHTHGMPFGMINILFGLLIGRASCSMRLKHSGAVFTASALCLPLGTALRGLTEGAPWATGLAAVGGASLLAACVIMIMMVTARQKE